MKTLWTYDDTKTRDELDIINAVHMTQNLYDHLTCAGLRHNLWPGTEEDASSHPGDRLEDAFSILSEYIDEMRKA